MYQRTPDFRHLALSKLPRTRIVKSPPYRKLRGEG